MFKMTYKTDYPNSIKVVSKIDDDDVSLTELFAYFVDMTQKMGYSMGSWEYVFDSVKECNEDYPIDLWATDIMVDHTMKN